LRHNSDRLPHHRRTGDPSPEHKTRATLPRHSVRSTRAITDERPRAWGPATTDELLVAEALRRNFSRPPLPARGLLQPHCTKQHGASGVASPYGKADVGSKLLPRPPKRRRPSLARARLAVCARSCARLAVCARSCARLAVCARSCARLAVCAHRLAPCGVARLAGVVSALRRKPTLGVYSCLDRRSGGGPR